MSERLRKLMAKKYLILFVFIAASLLLSACGGTVMATSWPGVSADQDMAYVANASFVTALKDNNQVWKYPAQGDIARNYYAQPAFTADLVIIGDYTGTIHAMDRNTGVERWTFAQISDRVVASPVVSGDAIIVAGGDGSLRALSLSGQERWKFQAKAGLWATPVIDNGRIYAAGMDHFVYAIDLKTGKQIWSLDVGASVLYKPTIGTTGILYVVTLSDELIAVDTARGTISWRFKTDGSVWGSPVLKDDLVLVGDLKSKVYAVTASNGSPRWTYPMPGPVTGTPAVIADAVVFTCETGDVVAVTIKGEKAWGSKINGKLYGGAVLNGERLLITAYQGEKMLYALDLSGKEIWTFAAPK
jgi:outer membrane protein assembly factor BamB